MGQRVAGHERHGGPSMPAGPDVTASMAASTSARVACLLKPASHQVAPARPHGAGSSPGAPVTTWSNGPADGSRSAVDLGRQLGELVRMVELDREEAVVARRAPHGPPVGPPRREPDRDPRALDGPGQQAHAPGLLAAPPGVEQLGAGVEQGGAGPRVGLLAEARQLPAAVAAEPEPADQAPARQQVQRRRLARELLRAAAGHRRDHRAQADGPGGRRDRGHRDPRVGDRVDVVVEHVVPDEDAVPAAGLGPRGQLREHARVGQLAERRDEDPAPHGAAVSPRR